MKLWPGLSHLAGEVVSEEDRAGVEPVMGQSFVYSRLISREPENQEGNGTVVDESIGTSSLAANTSIAQCPRCSNFGIATCCSTSIWNCARGVQR